MNEVKICKAWVTTEGQPPRVVDVSALTALGAGWTASVAEKGGTVVFRIAALDSSSQPALAGVRSLSPPNANEPEVRTWPADGNEFVSPAFAHGDEFRIEVSTAAQSDPVPVGGGHFRVVEEAGG